MIDRRVFLTKAALFGAAALPQLPWSDASAAPRPFKSFDTNKNGSLGRAEVARAATANFSKLNTDGDKDDTLDREEVGIRLGTEDFAAADPDQDGTLDKDEYLTIVEKLFSAADTDKTGTLSPAELQSDAGRALLRLIR